MTTSNTLKSDVLFTEAPASWNTKYMTPDGFECQLTLRGETGQEVLERAQGAIAFLLKNGCTPCISYKSANRNQSNSEEHKVSIPANGNNNGNGNTAGANSNSSSAKPSNGNANDSASETSNGNHDRGWCSIHQCEMKKWDKDGRVWYSHKVDGQWCSGKAKSK